MSAHTIRIAAALIVGASEKVLLVRKQGTAAFMRPGGKIEPNETAAEALILELYEELGLTVSPSSPQYIGRYSAIAANEPDAVVEAEVFRVLVRRVVGLAPGRAVSCPDRCGLRVCCGHWTFGGDGHGSFLPGVLPAL